MNTYQAIYNDGSIDFPFSVDNSLTVNDDREYTTIPVFMGSGSYTIYNGTSIETFSSGSISGSLSEYDYIFEEDTHLFRCTNGMVGVEFTANIPDLGETYNTSQSIYFPTSVVYSNSGNYGMNVSSNIPIFLYVDRQWAYIYGDNTKTLAQRNEALTHAFNYDSGDTSPNGREFRLEVQWTISTWTNDTQPTVVGQPYIQGVKGKITNCTTDAFGNEYVPFTLYKIEGIVDNKLKYGIINHAQFYDLEYTTDGVNWTQTDTFPFEFIYRPRTNELGTFGYALSEWNTDLPMFNNPDDAQDYIDGDKPITDADNWDKISPQYPPTNPTGIPDDMTEMGEVYTRAFFSQQYICSVNALQEISNAFFDTDSGGITGIVDDIIKGLRMYGNDVSQAIQGLMFFPIDLNQVFHSVQSQNYIYFGGYQFQMQNSVNKIIYPNGYVDFGSFVLKPSFNNYRDHNPYTRLYVYLAYCGWMELDIDRYLGKTVSIRYYLDTRTGGVLACIFANGVLTDYQNGQMGVQMPITTTSYTDFANAQIQTLLTFGNGQMSNAQNIAQMGGQLASEGVAMGAIGVGATALGGIGLGVGATKTLYGLTQNNINNFNKTKGASTSMLNLYLPQECMFLFEIQESDETPNERGLQGYPTNASGQIQSFSGYLEVDAVNLVCSGATDNEKAQIVAQLKSGVII